MILLFCGYLGALLCFLPEVTTLKIGGTIKCLSNSVQLHIDRNLYPSECTFGTNGEAFFTSSSDGGSTADPKCTVRNITDCSFTPGELGCGCTNSNTSHYSLQYNAQQITDTWWSASINCLENVTYSPALKFSNCTTETTTTPPTTTTTTGDTTIISTENTTSESTTSESTTTTSESTTTGGMPTTTKKGGNLPKQTTDYVVIGFCSAFGVIVIVVVSVLACKHYRRRKKRRELETANGCQPADRDSKTAGKENDHCRDTHM